MSPFDIANSKQELQQLEQKTAENDFWQKDQKETSKILAQIKQLKSKIEKGDRICQFRIVEKMPKNLRIKEVFSLENKDRGGFGSTGAK